jgi:hypothetical protein
MSENPHEQAEHPLITHARFKRSVSGAELEQIHEAALLLAPAFRDKLDFSEDAHYSALADYAYKAARALLAKRLTEQDALNAQLDADMEKAQKQIAKEKEGGK